MRAFRSEYDCVRGERLRTGLTLVELTVALSLAGLVLAMIAAIAVRQQRIFGDLAQTASLEGQLREALTVVPIDLRAIAPTLGDLRDARDTSLEFRATIGTSIVCDTSGGRAILYPTTSASAGRPSSAASYASLPTPLSAGDTAWLLSATDTSEQWMPLLIQTVGSAGAGACDQHAPFLDSLGVARSRVTIAAAGGGGDVVVPGAVLRFTRPLRYSLYHASDNEWYLGARDWNATAAHFNTIQPIAGPFLSATLGGLHLSYFDSTGAELPMPIGSLGSVAGVSVKVKGQTRGPALALSVANQNGRRVDSATVLIAFRGVR